MSVVKVIEVIGESDKGWEEAVKLCITDVAKSVRHIKRVWVKDFQAIVENESVIKYRANCKVSFVVENK